MSRAAGACAQVFRCRPRAKGWGVRCKRRIPAGGFVSEYAGELLNEAQAHARGVARGDEYLFDLDAWAHDVARERLERENLKAVVADDDEAPATPAAERADAVENSAIDQTERGLLIIDAKRCASVSRARFAASLRGVLILSLSLSLRPRYGNVGRFINHSCAPNLVKQVVFTASHDVRRATASPFFRGARTI